MSQQYHGFYVRSRRAIPGILLKWGNRRDLVCFCASCSSFFKSAFLWIVVFFIGASGNADAVHQDKEKNPSIEELVTTVRPSVVTIRHTGRGAQDAGLGTGFVVSSDGLIATNLHVIGEARPISVELSDGRVLDVT